MSHSVEVCIQYNGTLEQLKSQLEEILGIQLSHYEAGSEILKAYYGKLLTIDIELSVNNLDTDREMNFSDFQYVLSTRVAGQVCAQQLSDLQVPLTNSIGALVSKHLGVEVMVTIEVQELYARYQGP